MGRTQTVARTAATRSGTAPLARAVDLCVGVVALLLVSPVLAIIALAVRAGSHGPVLHRAPVLRRDGHYAQLRTFRTLMDGGDTDAHERVRAVIGADDRSPLTPVGRVLARTRLDRLPRVIDLVTGRTSLFN